jgi:hypothetical protein
MPRFFEGLLIDEEGCPGCAIITSELFSDPSDEWICLIHSSEF